MNVHHLVLSSFFQFPSYILKETWCLCVCVCSSIGLTIGNIVADFMSLKEKTKKIMVASLFVNVNQTISTNHLI
jgi:hypothetical protein